MRSMVSIRLKVFQSVEMMSLAGLVLTGSAFAANPNPATPTVDVSATVQSQCADAVNGAFSSLSIDPSNNADQPFTVATNATIQCTKNRSINVITASSTYGASKGTPVTCDGTYHTGFTMQGSDASHLINYSFTCASSITGNGFSGAGINVSLGIGAKVLAADALTADYDGGATYSDTITLTIAY